MTCKTTVFGTAALLAGLAWAAAAQEAEGMWRADLMPLNTTVAGSEAAGTATITVMGDMLTIQVDATGTAPGIAHLQHFHGFAEGYAPAACPGADADVNGDGVIDVTETAVTAGTTMLPFDEDPAGMDLLGGDFPIADANGAYSYKQSLALPIMMNAFNDKFPGQQLDLDRRVVFLHGVRESAAVPDSAQSVGGVPARITLPIACGELRRVEG